LYASDNRIYRYLQIVKTANNISMLTDGQLMNLYLNRRLDKNIWEAVQEELLRRDKNWEQAPAFAARKALSEKMMNDPLPGIYKIGLLLLPMIFPVYIAIRSIKTENGSARFLLFLLLPGGLIGHYGINLYLAQGKIKKWRAYWTWLCLGYVLWLLLLFAGARIYFQHVV